MSEEEKLAYKLDKARIEERRRIAGGFRRGYDMVRSNEEALAALFF